MKTISIYEELGARAEKGKIIRLGMIGFGRFPSTFIVQIDRDSRDAACRRRGDESRARAENLRPGRVAQRALQRQEL